jgi:hypothetical protein
VLKVQELEKSYRPVFASSIGTHPELKNQLVIGTTSGKVLIVKLE